MPAIEQDILLYFIWVDVMRTRTMRTMPITQVLFLSA
jgi:hypothetical protein